MINLFKKLFLWMLLWVLLYIFHQINYLNFTFINVSLIDILISIKSEIEEYVYMNIYCTYYSGFDYLVIQWLISWPSNSKTISLVFMITKEKIRNSFIF